MRRVDDEGAGELHPNRAGREQGGGHGAGEQAERAQRPRLAVRVWAMTELTARSKAEPRISML